MTRAEDAALAASLGVRYVGCVFAGGPRQRTPAAAAEVFAALDPQSGPRRAGVFAAIDPAALVSTIRVAGLHIVQLHHDPTPQVIATVRAASDRQIWAVVRCADGELPAGAGLLWDVADALLLDAHVPGRLGGTGKALPWRALGDAVRRSRAAARRPGRLIVAGGLTPDNVGEAIAALQPDVVDTSSGIESAPGVKDHVRMAAFVQAVTAADQSGPRHSNPSWSQS
jgi:phosphoribosylanthranilate isomerase